MFGVTAALLDDCVAALASAVALSRPVDPSAIVDAPGLVRAAVAFALVVFLGAVLLWRFEPLVDRSIDASMTRPLSSMAYGLAAHAVIVFAGIYLASRLAQFQVSGRSAGGIGLLAGLLLLLLASSLGFIVVGSTIAALWGEESHWSGLLVGALLAAAVALVDPVAGGVAWLVVVSTGIGGRIRTWLHASTVSAV